jgi:long-chain acyl-CoA synthetase
MTLDLMSGRPGVGDGVISATRTTGIEDVLGEPTLAHAFLRVAEAKPDRLALSAYGSDRSLTYGDWHAQARGVAGGLSDLHVGHGDRVALLMAASIDFHVVDMAILLLGAVPFSLYVSSPVAQLTPCVANAAPLVLIADAPRADKARALLRACPAIEHLIVVGGDGPEDDLAALEARCPEDFDLKPRIARISGEDLCSLVYTSGTTGPPKGVPYLHRGLMQTMASIHSHVPFSPEGRAIAYLPMAHIAERMFGHYAGFVFGLHITSLRDPAQLGAALREVRPTRFFGVPRIWEKLLAGLHRAIGESMEPAQATRARAAWAHSLERVTAQQDGRPAAPLSAADAEELIRLRTMLGLDAAEWLGVAGAPAGRETLLALHAAGLEVNELYGMSETIIVSTSPPSDVRIGTCGVPLPGVRVRVAADGEILIGGVTVMPGYFDDPVRTAEVLDHGWMHSGDIGSIDVDGYLTITDRKKAMIINRAGKNMSPAVIEQAIKGGVPLLAHVLTIGDGRRYNVALIVLDRDGLEAFRASAGIPAADFAQLSRHPQIRAAVGEAVEAGNAKLATAEQIKRHAVLDHEWAPASDELTPTAKLRREAITERYHDDIEELYA